jgi:hypothetical protein
MAKNRILTSKDASGNLFALTGEEEPKDPNGWDQMPECHQEDISNEIYGQIIVKFKTEQDFRDFCNVIGQPNISLKKSIHYPENKGDDGLWRWINEDEAKERGYE